jgi:ketosteroid isomerase-like protein
MSRFLCTPLLLFAVVSFSITGQAVDQQAAKKKAATSGELFDSIARMDSAMFDAFNGHDVDRLMSLFSDDLEFYHDTGGLTNYEQTKEGFKKLFATTPDIRRDLVKRSLEVYPVKDYGANEIGEHVFCHKEDDKSAGPARTDCGTFKFAMVWRKDGDSWKISRVISYGH